MASEIRVDKINSLSGVGTVTLSPTGVDISGITTVSTLKVGTGLTASSDGDVFFTGIATATTFSGSGASLTALPSAQLSGALPAISAASLTNVPAANVVGVHTSLTVTNATTTGTAVVGGGVTISESGIEASGIGITVASINGGSIGGRRNIVINGAMLVAQRGTSSTTAGYIVDRQNVFFSGTDEAITMEQGDVASGTSPYAEGFRKSLKITNGNQTSGAGSGDRIQPQNKIEAQDIANSGWDYTNPNSFITISFWVKSSVAQTFYGYFRSKDGTEQRYAYSAALSANTWTKVIKTIPGNSNLQFDNDANEGLQWNILLPFIGTDLTDSGVSLNSWGAYAGGTRTPDNTSTWYTTNDATFELTGLQLEVGTQATFFEHRTFAEELRGCQRYLFKNINESGELGCNYGKAFNTTELFSSVRFPVAMRATPTIIAYSNSGTAGQVHKLGSPDTAYTSIDRLDVYGGMRINGSNGTWGTGDTDMYSFTFQADAEL